MAPGRGPPRHAWQILIEAHHVVVCPKQQPPGKKHPPSTGCRCARFRLAIARPAGFAELAEVIKFERLNRGDEVRNYPQQGEANSQFGFGGGCALAIQ